jgi:hypothetical protein
MRWDDQMTDDESTKDIITKLRESGLTASKIPECNGDGIDDYIIEVKDKIRSNQSGLNNSRKGRSKRQLIRNRTEGVALANGVT